MARVKGGVTSRRRHKKVLTANKGYRMTKSRLYRVAKEAYLHALQYAFAGRRDRKGNFRRLWITRINIALRGINPDYSYSRFVKAMKDGSVEVDRKILADLAVSDPTAFETIVKQTLAK